MHKQDNINEDGSGALRRTIHPLLRLLLPIYCVFRGRPPWFIMDHGVSRVKKYWHPANFRVRILLDFFILFMSALEALRRKWPLISSGVLAPVEYPKSKICYPPCIVSYSISNSSLNSPPFSSLSLHSNYLNPSNAKETTATTIWIDPKIIFSGRVCHTTFIISVIN